MVRYLQVWNRFISGPHEKVVGEDESQQLVSETVSDNIDQESESISELGVDEDQSLPQADQPDNTTDASDSQNEL